MTIHVINPNSSEAVTQSVSRAIEPMHSACTAALQCHTLQDGPVGIETQSDIDNVIEPLLAYAEQLEQGASAFIIACFSDPGIEQLRKQSAKPVIGIAEASIITALTMGQRFGILSILEQSLPRHQRYIETMGVAQRMAGDLALGLGIAELRQKTRTFDRLCYIGARLLDTHDAEVLILGCAGLSDYRAALEKSLGCPVIDPSQAATAMAIGQIAHERSRMIAGSGADMSSP